MNYFIISNIRHDQEKLDQLRNKIDVYCSNQDGNWMES